jgi:hypothetical protein
MQPAHHADRRGQGLVLLDEPRVDAMLGEGLLPVDLGEITARIAVPDRLD